MLSRAITNSIKNEGYNVKDSHGGLTFLYTSGASLEVAKPAVPLLSTGPISYPLNRPIAAVA